MAAKKAAKKAPRKAAARKRQSAPSKPSDADIVRASAANPSASLVGSEQVIQTAGPLKITIVDGARATLEVAKHDPLSQAELQTAVKDLNQAIQGIY